MYEIDKQRFGAFVASLRKEKGLTQKEIAARLFISDKAISKWETGVSIPDTALLIPLSELLEVSVTELLMCQRFEKAEPIGAKEMETLVKTALSYSEEAPLRAYQAMGKWGMIYALSLMLGIIGLTLCHLQGFMPPVAITSALLGAVFGGYFCFLVRTKLPRYYDENRISGVMDGPFRMNVPGLVFNNRNWPHIVRVGKVWACACAGLYPLASAAMLMISTQFFRACELFVMLPLLLGGLFIPLYVVGKKYQ